MSVIWQQSTHGVPRRHERVNRVTAIVFFAALGVVSLLAFAYLALAASSAQLSAEIWQIHMEVAKIQRQNSYLQTEIGRLSSIPVLQSRSEALGYAPAESIEFIDMERP